jgi:hypothetical protein
MCVATWWAGCRGEISIPAPAPISRSLSFTASNWSSRDLKMAWASMTLFPSLLRASSSNRSSGQPAPKSRRSFSWASCPANGPSKRVCALRKSSRLFQFSMSNVIVGIEMAWSAAGVICWRAWAKRASTRRDKAAAFSRASCSSLVLRFSFQVWPRSITARSSAGMPRRNQYPPFFGCLWRYAIRRPMPLHTLFVHQSSLERLTAAELPYPATGCEEVWRARNDSNVRPSDS